MLVSTLFSIYQGFALIEARRIFELTISAFLVFLFIKDIWNESNWLIFAKMLMVTGAISGLSLLLQISLGGQDSIAYIMKKNLL